MYNQKIAQIFEEIADMQELEGSYSIFEIRAYRKAAVTIGTLQEDVGEIIKKRGSEGLMELPGVGKGIAGAIKEYVDTGKIKKYEDLKKKYPIDFAGLTKINGMGAKKAFKLYKNLGVKNVNDLKKAAEKGKIKALDGFGEKSEQEILKGLAMLESAKGRMLLGDALPEAEMIKEKLLKHDFIDRVEIAGSARRMKETVGDLDVLVISNSEERAIREIKGLGEVERILMSGPTKVSVLLKIGINCDFRIVARENFSAALQYFTGSKEHNVQVRQIAIKKGYKLNEYGLLDKNNKNFAGESEEELYKKLGLQYMEPEMREGRGEVDLAAKGIVPKLVNVLDLQGDLHTHTDNSDGANSLEEIANAAIGKKYKYLGITDHSKSEYVANGMDDKKFLAYFKKIDALNEKIDEIKILKSGEIDILKNGTLDLENKTLHQMDYRLASVHSNLKMSGEEMTNRIVKALESGYVDILGHPTDRIIHEREPIQFYFEKVFEAAQKNNVIMEIDSFPSRLDLNDENILRAKEYKLKFSISSDAHRLQHLDFTRYGIGAAKRAWLTKDDVVNTLPLEKLIKLFKR